MPTMDRPNSSTIWRSSKLPLRPRTARSHLSSASRSKSFMGGDTDSGYSSRPSTSLSMMSPRPSDTLHTYLYNGDMERGSIAEIREYNREPEYPEEQHIEVPTKHDSNSDEEYLASPTRPNASPIQCKDSSQSQQDVANRRPKNIHNIYEPRQLTQWQSYMKSVTSKIDCKWTSREKASFQSANMMKHKIEQQDAADCLQNKEDGEISRVRSASRQQRTRPWRDKSSASPRSAQRKSNKSSRANSVVEIHYEKTLPSSVWTECKPKKYVTNHKYGNHYERRPCRSAKQRYAPTDGMKFLWENNCQVWLMEKTGATNFSLRNDERMWKNKVKAVTAFGSTLKEQSEGSQQRPRTAPVTAREMATEHKEWKSKISTATPADKANVFDKFVEWSMANQKRKYAAISIQRIVKGWLVRMKINRLKSRCMMKHGCNWNKLCNDYKSTLARIQRRCGEPKPSCPLTYRDIELYMDKKEKYEVIFDEMKDSEQMLPRKDIMPLFRKCGLFPLDREVDAAFRAVFKGCSVQSDVVFVVDCSASIGKTVYDMQIGLIRDIIGHCDVAYDKIRVAVIPYNDASFRVIDFDSYGCKEELLSELDDLSYEKVREYGQITRTDLGLKCMTELVERVGKINDHIRDGSQIPKICFAFTDGKCYHTQLTAKWAEYAKKDLKVTMYAVTCSDEKKSKPYLLDIAKDVDHVLSLADYKTLRVIKTSIQNQQCLKSCALCHYAQKTYGEAGKSCSDEKRGLFKHEVMELIWMVYCPPATGLKKYRDSLWMSPQIEGKESMKLTRYHPVGTDYRACLRRAVEERIAETGKVILPTETGVRVREITDPDLAMDFIDQLCVTKLSTLGLVEKVGLNVKISNKYEK